MLVLSRKKNEAIIVGENIVVTVIEIKGNTVRLGVDAPDEVGIWRRELIDVDKRHPRTLD